ncbi:DgyrCDS9322 [Dimorphilus gyrociliatus]|uniref:DgyrCDS9322 n=1 Tax=Dimorphilus gyrociliatus TaxID=2664684 RepID=A0A7I8W1V7_9ANNE|nr:DgyrCDS9322 [Dimorphilus gyrociliatus]
MASDRNPRERIVFKASPGTFSDNQIDFIDFKELVYHYAEKTHTHGPAYFVSARGKLTSYFWSLCFAASNFRRYNHHLYKNCYLYNEFGLLEANSMIEDTGLKFLVNSPIIRLEIHEETQSPLPEIDGIYITPATINHVGIRRMEWIDNPQSYSNCEYLTKKQMKKRDYFAFKWSKGMTELPFYTRQTCIYSLFQRIVEFNCNCNYYEYLNNSLLESCNNSSIFKSCIDSSKRQLEQINRDKLNRICPDVCHRIKYNTRVTTLPFREDINQTEVNVFYSTMITEKYRNEAKGDLYTTAANIGGILSVLAGISIMSILEGFNFIIDAIRYSMAKLCKSSTDRPVYHSSKTGFLLLTSTVSAVNLGWEKSEDSVREGEDYVINCVLPATESVRIIEKSRAALYLVGTPGLVDKNNRYAKTTDSETDGRTIIKFHLSRAQGSDSGVYKCSCTSEHCKETVYNFTLNVLVLPRKVEFRSYAPFSNNIVSNKNGSVVTLNEVNRKFLSCLVIVQGSKVKPKVTISRDKEVSGEKNVDVTSDFGLSIKSSEESDLNFNMSYTLKSNSVAIEYNNAKLTCSAQVPETKKISTEVKVVIEYSPKLNCEAVEFRRRVGDKFKIVCKVRSNPKADVSLTLPKGGNLKNSPDFGLKLYEEKNKYDDEREINILISKVAADKHYGKYTIKAENKFGKADYDFKLIKTQEYKSLVGGNWGGKLETSMSTTLLILLLVFVLLRN